VRFTPADDAEINRTVEHPIQDLIGFEVLKGQSYIRVCRRKARKARQQQPLDQTLASADNKFERLPGAGATEFLQRAKRMADDFVKPLAGTGQRRWTMTTLE